MAQNLSHVLFGRLNKKWEEYGKDALVAYIEQQSDYRLTPTQRRAVVQGASEQALVHSGDTMVNAIAETRLTADKLNIDLRTANAIHKIASVQIDSGSFFLDGTSLHSVLYGDVRMHYDHNGPST